MSESYHIVYSPQAVDDFIVDMNSMTVTVIRIVYGGRDIQGITAQKE